MLLFDLCSTPLLPRRRLTIGLAGVDWDVFPASLIILLFLAPTAAAAAAVATAGSDECWLRCNVVWCCPTSHCHTASHLLRKHEPVTLYRAAKIQNTNTNRHFWRARYSYKRSHYRMKRPEFNAGANLNEAPELQQLTLNFLATFLVVALLQRLPSSHYCPRGSSVGLFT